MAGTAKAFETTFDVANLIEEVPYFFSVAAENEAGVGEACETTSVCKISKPISKYRDYYYTFFLKVCLHTLLQCFPRFMQIILYGNQGHLSSTNISCFIFYLFETDELTENE
jgi:hypothetical protein